MTVERGSAKKEAYGQGRAQRRTTVDWLAFVWQLVCSHNVPQQTTHSTHFRSEGSVDGVVPIDAFPGDYTVWAYFARDLVPANQLRGPPFSYLDHHVLG